MFRVTVFAYSGNQMKLANIFFFSFDEMYSSVKLNRILHTITTVH